MGTSANKELHLPIIVEMDEDNIYIVSCPLFKGCHSYGNTIEEAMANIEEVIQMCIEETDMQNVNHFIGFRELAVKRA